MRSVAATLGDDWPRHAPAAWSARWPERPFELEGGTTRVVRFGRGPALVLVPPVPGFKEAWAPCAQRLAERFTVVTWDLRVRFSRARGWEAHADDLERVADALAPGRVGLVGHSLGGAIALRWALRRPERVAALVLSSTFARLASDPRDLARRWLEQPLVLASQRWLPRRAAAGAARALARRERWVYDRRCDDAVLGFVRLGIRRGSIGAALAQARLALTLDLRSEVRGLRAPALVIAGEREGPSARASSAELARLLPGAETQVSPGAGHLHPVSSPGWLAETIAAWMTPRLAGVADPPDEGPRAS